MVVRTCGYDAAGVSQSSNIRFSPSLGNDSSAWHVWGNAFVNVMSNRVGQTYLYHQLSGETFVGGTANSKLSSSFQVYSLVPVSDLDVAQPNFTEVTVPATQQQQKLRTDGMWTKLEVSGINVEMDHRLSTWRPAAIISDITVQSLSQTTRADVDGVWVAFNLESIMPTPLGSYEQALLYMQKCFTLSVTTSRSGAIATWTKNPKKQSWYVHPCQFLDGSLPTAPPPVFVNVTGGQHCNCEGGKTSVQIFTDMNIPPALRTTLPSGYGQPAVVFLPISSSCTLEFGVLTEGIELPDIKDFPGINPQTFAWQVVPVRLPKLPASLATWADALQNEAQWKLAQLTSWSTYRAALGTFAVPQGSAYEYTIADLYIPNTGDMLRDTGLIPVVAAGSSAALAKSILENRLRLQQGWPFHGELPYVWFGLNATQVAAGTHSDLDMQLFLGVTLALEEGIVDCEWLTLRKLPFLGNHPPESANHSITVLSHLRVALAHFKGVVGRGPHGLVRAMAGDWSDDLITSQRQYDQENSETVMVTALAVVTLRRFSAALAKTCPTSEDAANLVNESMSYRDQLKVVLADRSSEAGAWSTKGAVPHYRRAVLYSKKSDTPNLIGEEYVDLNAQLWPLISTDEDGLLSSTERQALLEHVHDVLDAPNALGPSMIPLDQKEYPGLGPQSIYFESHFWARPTGLLLKAYALNNKTDWGWDLLRRSSNTHHCHLFPKAALGCTSGPDAEDAGGGAWNLAGIEDMTSFPWANANPNAMWLWGLMALSEAESSKASSPPVDANPVALFV